MLSVGSLSDSYVKKTIPGISWYFNESPSFFTPHIQQLAKRLKLKLGFDFEVKSCPFL